MNFPKKLEEQRDELAERYSSMSYPALTRMRMSQDFHSGFNSACNLLLPEIEKFREALFRLTVRASIHDIKPSADIVRQALKSWQAFLGEKSEDK